MIKTNKDKFLDVLQHNEIIERGRKKHLNDRDFAELLQDYLKRHRYSQRMASKVLGIPKSTIYDWLLPLKITAEEQKNMQKNGLTDTDIYRLIRNNQKVEKSAFVDKSKIEYELEFCIKKLNPLLSLAKSKKIAYKQEIADRIREIRDILNHIEMYVKPGDILG